MQYLWFSLLLLPLSVMGQTKFSSLDCFQSNFEAKINGGESLFGLIKNELKIEKEKCHLEIEHKKIFKKEWKIDICREPIHVKVKSNGSESVYKRLSDCKTGESNDFCDSWKELKLLIEDNGLIYADGEREIISTDHGKTFCSYLLLKKYLGEGKLFSLFDHNIDIYEKENISSVLNQEVVTPMIEKKEESKGESKEGEF